ncbi:MAG: acyl-CoA reductase [Gemmatimonadota bacterium]
MIEAWYLPGREPGRGDSDPGRESASAGWWESRTPAGVPFRAPRLSEEEAGAVAREVRAAALHARRERSLSQLIGAVSRAAVRLGDPDEWARNTALGLLRDELGWTAELAAETLSGMASIWSEAALWQILRSELRDPRVLESFRPEPLDEAGEPDGKRASSAPARPPADLRRRRRATGPPLMLQVHSANLPGVGVTAAVRGLLARSGVLCRVSRGEPGLLPLFARALAEEDPLLGRSLAVTWWPAESDEPAWDLWVKRSGKVIVYGGDVAVNAVRRRIPPHTDLIVYGPKLGVGVVLADAVGDATCAAGLARDVCAYEQRGCVSPRLILVVGDAMRFAASLSDALERETKRHPGRVTSPEEAVAIRSLRAEAEFGSYAERTSGEAGVLASRDDVSWTVIVKASPELEADDLPRVVRVFPVSGPGDVERVLGPLEGHVQAVGYAGEEGAQELAEAAARLGVSRVAPFGRMAWPPADWRHDGRFQLLPLLQWTDWEKLR